MARRFIKRVYTPVFLSAPEELSLAYLGSESYYTRDDAESRIEDVRSGNSVEAWTAAVLIMDLYRYDAGTKKEEYSKSKGGYGVYETRRQEWEILFVGNREKIEEAYRKNKKPKKIYTGTRKRDRRGRYSR